MSLRLRWTKTQTRTNVKIKIKSKQTKWTKTNKKTKKTTTNNTESICFELKWSEVLEAQRTNTSNCIGIPTCAKYKVFFQIDCFRGYGLQFDLNTFHVRWIVVKISWNQEFYFFFLPVTIKYPDALYW